MDGKLGFEHQALDLDGSEKESQLTREFPNDRGNLNKRESSFEAFQLGIN